MNRYRLKKAFTIAEALIILLAVSLLAVAVVPALTKKHVKIGTHGKWICTVDNNGNHYVATEYKGKMSDFVYVGPSCSFTPPANAKNILIKAVGGGGAGAMGEMGAEEVLFQSTSKGELFVKSIPQEGYYYITAVGGGGAGGGIGCGEYKDHYKNPNTLFSEDSMNLPDGSSVYFYTDGSSYANLTNQSTYNASTYGYNWNMSKQQYDTYNDEVNATPSGIVYPTSVAGKKYTYGYVYKPYSGYNYKALVKNDNRYSEVKDNSKIQWLNSQLQWQSAVPIDEFKYKHLPSNLQREYQVCFPTESSSSIWPFAKKYEFLGKVVEGMYVKNPTGNKNAICWNLPSQGGKVGKSISEKVYVNGGENIVITTGRGGKSIKNANSITVKDHDGSTYTAAAGGVGDSGTETSVSVGSNHFSAGGGAAGYARNLRNNIAFLNIPLQICEIKKSTYNGYLNNSNCGTYNSSWTEDKSYANKYISNCDATPGCNSYLYDSGEKERIKSCEGGGYCYLYGWSKYYCEKTTYKEKTKDEEENEVEVEKNCVANMETYHDYRAYCSSGKHSGPMYTIGSCENIVKSAYFAGKVSACASTSPTTVGNVDNEVTADIPGINGTIHNTRRIWLSEEEDSVLKYPEAYMKQGSLGYGSGGYGIGITSASYLGFYSIGSHYKSIRFDGYDGEDGYAEVKKVSYSAGGGGQAGQYISTSLRKTGRLTVTVGKGGVGVVDGKEGKEGGITEIKDQNGKTLIKMLGGKGGIPHVTSVLNQEEGGSMAGVDGALSPFESPYNKARAVPYGGKSGTNTAFGGISPATPKWAGSYNKYGSPLVMTYGAGGGGGGASKIEAGAGGNGAAGAVIIEW